MIPRGELNAVIDIQRDQGSGINTSGEPNKDWQTVHTGVWCVWEQKNGTEGFESDQKVSKQPIMVKLDYISGVTGKDRIVKDSKNYRIIGEPEYSEYRGLSDPDTMVLKCLSFDNE